MATLFELLELADEAKSLLVHAKTENFVIWRAENFIAKVEPILRKLSFGRPYVASSEEPLTCGRMRPELEALIEAAKARWDTMSPEQKEAELRAQCASWARQDKD